MNARLILRSTTGLFLLLSVSSCTSEPMMQMQSDMARLFDGVTSFNLFSDDYLDPKDACYAERQTMAEQSRFFDAQQEIGEAIAVGIVAGVVTGLITRDVETGVAVGAIAAGTKLAAAYIQSMRRQGLNSSQITHRVSGDIEAENERIDALVKAFDEVDKCRQREAKEIKNNYSDKKIDRAEAEKQMLEVRTRRNEDVAKFQQIAEQIDTNSRNYAAIYNDIAADNGGRGLVVEEPRKKVRRPRRAEKTAGTAQDSLAGVSKADVRKLERDCLRNVRKRDDTFKRVERAKEDSEEISLDTA